MVLMRGLLMGIICFGSVIGFCQKQAFGSFDGTVIAFTDEGSGFPVVLIHGFINDGSMWGLSVLKTDLLKAGYRVIIPDLRGCGDSDHPHHDSAYSNNAEVEDLRSLLGFLDIESYCAVGYSRGSILLAKLLATDSRIEKAVIGGMGLDFTNPDWERRIMFANAFNGQPNRLTQGAVDYAKSINADFQSLYLQQKHQPVTAIKELKTITADVLVIAGDKDLDNGSPQELSGAVPRSNFKLIPGDHNNTYKTKEFSKAIIDFLK